MIRGNTAILKCNIPSFVADFVLVDAWIRADGTEYAQNNDYGILPLARGFIRFLEDGEKL